METNEPKWTVRLQKSPHVMVGANSGIAIKHKQQSLCKYHYPMSSTVRFIPNEGP